MFKQIYLTIPLLFFAGLLVVFYKGLHLSQQVIPSPFIAKPAPAFSLKNLFNSKEMITENNFLGHVTLLNVWATWCDACIIEHALLNSIAQDEHLFIYGLNYKDNKEHARFFLKKNGNPYKKVAVDTDGTTAINYGVYGTPETFIIDKWGKIRYKQIGPITPALWQHTLKILIMRLDAE